MEWKIKTDIGISERGIERKCQPWKRGGETIASWVGYISLLLKNFFPRSASRLQISEYLNSAPELERGELVPCFAKLKSRKSPGVDGITGEMWRQVFRIAPEYIESIIQDCLRVGYFLTQWKIAKVTILLKSPRKLEATHPLIGVFVCYQF